jgi:hypothetical protein
MTKLMLIAKQIKTEMFAEYFFAKSVGKTCGEITMLFRGYVCNWSS